jgi:hypothetical protein
VRGLSSRQPPISKGEIIGARVKFSVRVSDGALKRLSTKAFINFAKVQLSIARRARTRNGDGHDQSIGWNGDNFID